jgi:predicted metal-dependent hydrolase
VLRLLRKKRPIEAPDEVGGVRVKASQRARRMALRVDVKAGDIVLTWPRGASEHSALRFIEQNRQWIEQHRRKLPQPKAFVEGEVISVHGQEYKIVRRDGRGVTCLIPPKYPHPNLLPEGEGTKGKPPLLPLPLGEGRGEGTIGHLIVHGRPEHMSRRIKDFLKEKAREVLEDIAGEKLSDINQKPAGVRVIDPKTRWGSCSPDGRMMFSWRLILAPPEVLDYVVAHEVAHRIHMNHSRKFWALCASLTGDAGTSRRWLRTHGSALMAYR